MANQHPTDFSFDVYPGLDRELDDIYARNVQSGVATPETVASGGLAAAVGNVLSQPTASPLDTLPMEVLDWAHEELEGAIAKWDQYAAIFPDGSRPTSLWDLEQENPRFAEKLHDLFHAKRRLTESGELNPDGENVGESMHLVLIPWAQFKGHLGGDGLITLLSQIRGEQGITTADFFNATLKEAIQSSTEMYRSPVDSTWVSANDYLDQRIAEDGDWGVMLVQTTPKAGLKRIVEGPAAVRSPDAMTDHGTSRFEVAGTPVDSLGIFEWLSLAAQEDPRQLSPEDYSWMLANRLTDSSGGPNVPAGDFYDGRVESVLRFADYRVERARVRLAVI